jgi:putative component of toxin-antitoxin plasmid stabilization module
VVGGVDAGERLRGMALVRLEETGVYRRWYDGIRDVVAKGRIHQRLLKAEGGHFGKVGGVGEGV